MLAAILTTCMFAVSAVCAHRSARMLGGATANLARLLLAAVLLAIWAHGFGAGLTGVGLPVFLLSGVVGFGVGDLAFFQALPRLGSRLTVLIAQCMAVPIAAITEWIWLGTGLTLAQGFWCGWILAGVGIALTPVRDLGRSGYRVSGILYAVMAAGGQGMGAVMSRKAFAMAAAASESVDGMSAAYQRVLGGLLVAFLGWWVARWRCRERGSRWHGGAWAWVVGNSLAGPVLGVTCYQWALKTTPTGLVLSIVAITPLLVIPLAAWIEHERPTRRSLVGGAVAVAGAVGLALGR